MARQRTIPYADACRLIIAKDQVGDLESALQSLGVSLTGLNVELDEESEPLPDEFEIEEGYEDPEDNLDEDGGFGGEGAGPLSEAWRPAFANRRPSLRFERTMVAYLLAEDERDDDEQDETPSPEYDPVPDKVQEVHRPSTTPDPEAWRIARRISDSGPKSHHRGRIDIRACVSRIARREPIESLPYLKKTRHSHEPKILVDNNFCTGVFAADVEQLLTAMHSIGLRVGNDTKRLQYHSAEWITWKPPFGAIERLDEHGWPSWYVIITGGEQATPDNLGLWQDLVATLAQEHFVTLVWLGDVLVGQPRNEDQSWMAYRR